MEKEDKFQIVNTIAFVIFFFAIGEVTAMLLTGLIFDISYLQLFETIRDPSQANRSLLLLLSCFSTLFRFIIIPALYLSFTNRSSLDFLWTNSKVRFTSVLLTIVLVLTLIPSTSLLIDLNYKLELPPWLDDVEAYLKEGEEKARTLTSSLFAFREPQDLAIAILIVAIIPGMAEEFLFRGVVQGRLQNVLKNHHYAILLSAALFSFFHFQFYGFIPRMALGILLGYMFYWSKNIWYPVAMHATNNLIGILGVYFLGPQIMNPQSGSSVAPLLVVLSIAVSVPLILYVKRMLTSAAISEN